MSERTTTLVVLGAITLLLAVSLSGVILVTSNNNNSCEVATDADYGLLPIIVGSPEDEDGCVMGVSSQVTCVAADSYLYQKMTIVYGNDFKSYLPLFKTVTKSGEEGYYVSVTAKEGDSAYGMFKTMSVPEVEDFMSKATSVYDLTDLLKRDFPEIFNGTAYNTAADYAVTSAPLACASADSYLYQKMTIVYGNDFKSYLPLFKTVTKSGEEGYYVSVTAKEGDSAYGMFKTMSVSEVEDFMSKATSVYDLTELLKRDFPEIFNATSIVGSEPRLGAIPDF